VPITVVKQSMQPIKTRNSLLSLKKIWKTRLSSLSVRNQ
jgi:hypothetical protein